VVDLVFFGRQEAGELPVLLCWSGVKGGGKRVKRNRLSGGSVALVFPQICS